LGKGILKGRSSGVKALKPREKLQIRKTLKGEKIIWRKELLGTPPGESLLTEKNNDYTQGRAKEQVFVGRNDSRKHVGAWP